MQVELYTQKEVKETRDKLLKAQGGKCLVSKVDVQGKEACLDHSHKSQHVRGVLHRQINVALGRIESAYLRDVSWWCDKRLPELLRAFAEYLERDTSGAALHPGWIKTVKSKFNKLPEGKKDAVLKALSTTTGANAKERKELFRRAVLTRAFTYQQLLLILTAITEGA